ncbi:MAG: hypothetical protein OER92_05020 [Alphaproteobacteria bacterium]|nr:hypothetical protein [Alphaproteobacteria bacterium]
MNPDPFQTDPVLRRAAGYPYDITQTSFTFFEGAAAPFDPALTRGRHPVIGYGSNQSPQRLRQKYGTEHSPIPVQRGRLADHDVVYSAHFATYGSLPAALRRVEGTTVSVAVNWLDDAQLADMHPTEWDNYHYARLTDLCLQLEEGEALVEAYAYLSFRGHSAAEGAPIALAEVSAENRRHDACTQIEALTLMRDRLAPGVDLAEFVHEHIADAQVRASRVERLMDAAVAVHHGAHEIVYRGRD